VPRSRNELYIGRNRTYSWTVDDGTKTISKIIAFAAVVVVLFLNNVSNKKFPIPSLALKLFLSRQNVTNYSLTGNYIT